MKNPCYNCIVRACCTVFCEDKEGYSEDLNTYITHLGTKYIYSKSGNKRKKVPKHIKDQWTHLIRCQKINLQEINNIVDRVLIHEESM